MSVHLALTDDEIRTSFPCLCSLGSGPLGESDFYGGDTLYERIQACPEDATLELKLEVIAELQALLSYSDEFVEQVSTRWILCVLDVLEDPEDPDWDGYPTWRAFWTAVLQVYENDLDVLLHQNAENPVCGRIAALALERGRRAAHDAGTAPREDHLSLPRPSSNGWRRDALMAVYKDVCLAFVSGCIGAFLGSLHAIAQNVEYTEGAIASGFVTIFALSGIAASQIIWRRIIYTPLLATFYGYFSANFISATYDLFKIRNSILSAMLVVGAYYIWISRKYKFGAFHLFGILVILQAMTGFVFSGSKLGVLEGIDALMTVWLCALVSVWHFRRLTAA